MAVFPFRQKAIALPPIKAKPVDEKADPSELNDAHGGLTSSDHIYAPFYGANQKSSLSAASYIAFDNVDDQGGYYGAELDIRSTAGRIKALFAREPWIYAAATIMARDLSSIPLKVRKKGDAESKPLDKHPLNKLLSSGTDLQSPQELRWVQHLDQSLAGNSFLVLSENFQEVVGQAPAEMVNLQYSKDYKRIEKIELYGTDQQRVSTTIDMKYVVQNKMPNPYTPFFGLSPFVAAARPILTDRYMSEYMMTFFLRGATMPGVVETTEDLSQSRFRRLMRTFEMAFTGKANWWRTLFMPKGATWKNSSISMADMELLAQMNRNPKVILAVLGIPPSMCGIIEDVNRATSEQQERVYWLNTVLPMAQFFAAGWNNSYVVKEFYKGAVEVFPDLTGLEVLEGTVANKGEKSKAMESTHLIDEIREIVWKSDPLPNGKGQIFVSQAKPVALPPAGNPSGTPPEGGGNPPPTPAPDPANIDDPPTNEDPAKTQRAARKTVATASQNRIERRATEGLYPAVKAWLSELTEETAKALHEKRDVRKYLAAHATARQERFMLRALPVYERAMDWGFAAATAQIKNLSNVQEKAGPRFDGLTETDKEAIDILRAKTRSGQRALLEARGIGAFEGFDPTATERIMQMIEDGFAAGMSFEEIAADLRGSDGFEESYVDQARTIVRTEILSAVSIGQAWNHEVLGQIFSEVNKQWLSQDDDRVRDDHLAFEELGEVAQDFVFTASDGSQLEYPRDPNGSAGQVINCRCTLVSTIPDSAISNADSILETET